MMTGQGHIFRHQAVRPAVAWLETLIITVLLPVIGWFVHPQDPLLLNAAFPWIVFAPLLTGIRYGFVHGFSSGLLLACLALVVPASLVSDTHHYPYQHALALVLTGMLAGQFADMWSRRLSQMQTVHDEAGAQLARFARSYTQLKLSHDELEERLAGQGYNLRGSLNAFREHFANRQVPGRDFLQHHARDILDFMVANGRIHGAALHAVHDNRRLGKAPLASLDEQAHLADHHHPMVQACLARGQLIHLKHDDAGHLERRQRQDMLAVIPLIDIHDHIWAVITVTAMPFIVYTDRTLHMLTVLGAAMGDLISDHARSQTRQPEDPVDRFRTQLAIWTDYVRKYRIDVALVRIELDPTRLDSRDAVRADQLIIDQARTLDTVVRIEDRQARISMLALLPMTGPHGIEGYQQRILDVLTDANAPAPTADAIRFHGSTLDGKDDADTLFDRSCEACRHAGDS